MKWSYFAKKNLSITELPKNGSDLLKQRVCQRQKSNSVPSQQQLDSRLATIYKEDVVYYKSIKEEEANCIPIYAHKWKQSCKGGLSEMTIVLPATPNIPKTGWPEQDSWLIYGQAKIGKSTLAGQFPDPLVLDLEGGCSGLTCHVLRIHSMEELREAYELLDRQKGGKFKTVIIDSIDVVYDWVEEEVCKYLSFKLKAEINNIEEAPHGAGWSEGRKRLLGMVGAWQQLPMAKVFIAHAKAVMGEKGTVIEKARTIDLPGKLSHRFPAQVDTIGFCYGVKETVNGKKIVNRYLSFQPYDDLEAGSRRKQLEGKVIPMSFSAIKDCFESPKSVKTSKLNGGRK